MSKPDTDQPVGAERGYKRRKCSVCGRDLGYGESDPCSVCGWADTTEPSPTKAAVCVKCGHRKIDDGPCIVHVSIPNGMAYCGCECVFPTPEAAEPLTVESCLKELREMFPYESHNLWVHDSCRRLDVEIAIDGVRRARIYNSANGLEEAMAQVRRWKESQK